MSSGEALVSIIAAALASSGLWTLIAGIYAARHQNRSIEQKALLGLLHERVYSISEDCVRKGHITREEYETLEYIYVPYKELGGNGTGERLWNEINRLPLREENIQNEQRGHNQEVNEP